MLHHLFNVWPVTVNGSISLKLGTVCSLLCVSSSLSSQSRRRWGERRQREGGERQKRGERRRGIDTTEHSAQHMFLLRPLLPRGLFDPSEFLVNLTAHSPSHAGGSRSLPPTEPQRGSRRGRAPENSFWRGEMRLWVLFRYGHFFFFFFFLFFFTTKVSLPFLETDESLLFPSTAQTLMDKTDLPIAQTHTHTQTHYFDGGQASRVQGRHQTEKVRVNNV